ncbi:hypothetical protein J6TS7_34270 [Paenibacillus dendritiformis]|nr:hypothetical protein J6TS7_34270 [Paenibacillus dendritiformis]
MGKDGNHDMDFLQTIFVKLVDIVRIQTRFGGTERHPVNYFSLCLKSGKLSSRLTLKGRG